MNETSYTWETTHRLGWHVGLSGKYYNGDPNQALFYTEFQDYCAKWHSRRETGQNQGTIACCTALVHKTHCETGLRTTCHHDRFFHGAFTFLFCVPVRKHLIG